MRLSSQEPKTPGMSWLQKDKLSCNSFTPGSNLFKPSSAVQESQISYNDSGLDASSQSNFLFTLKNESVQNSNCKRNLAFNTPFKLEENRQESSLKEVNQLLHQKYFPKLKFTSENIDENKENAIIEKNTGQVVVKESVGYDVFQNNVKPSFDKDCKQFSPAAFDNDTILNTNSEKLLWELNKPPCASNSWDNKIEDESSNTPIDLSSGKCTHDNIFSKSFLNEKEQNSEQPKESTKEVRSTNKDEVSSKEKCSSDGLSSILPTFLAPVNMGKSNEVTNTALNDLSGAIINVEKATITCLPVVQNETPKPTQQMRNGVSSWVSTNIIGKSGLKPPSADEAKPISNEGHIVQNDISKSSHAANLRKKHDFLVSDKDLHENAAAKNYDQLSAMINLSNRGNDDNSNSVVSNKMSKPKNDPHFHALDRLSESNLLNPAHNFDSNNEFIPAMKHLAEDRFKTLTANCKMNAEYKSEPISTLNPDVSNIPCPGLPNESQARGTNPLNFNSNPPIPLSLNHQENNVGLSLKKSSANLLSFGSQSQLSHYNQLQESSAKTTEPQEVVNHRVAKGSRLHPYDQSASIHQDHFLLSNGPMQSLLQCPEVNHQKTYLAPQQSSDHRSSDNFPHVKPDAPQLINNRLNCHTVKKPQSFKMAAPRGLLSRSNTELYVNGKVYATLSMLGRGGSSEVYQVSS